MHCVSCIFRFLTVFVLRLEPLLTGNNGVLYLFLASLLESKERRACDVFAGANAQATNAALQRFRNPGVFLCVCFWCSHSFVCWFRVSPYFNCVLRLQKRRGPAKRRQNTTTTRSQPRASVCELGDAADRSGHQRALAERVRAVPRPARGGGRAQKLPAAATWHSARSASVTLA